MDSFVFSFLSLPKALLMAAPDGGAGAAGTGNPIVSFIPFILIIGIFYFLMIRPQNKRQKETQKMLAALKKGDKIVTVGGIHGVIQSVKEKSVIVKIDENVKVEFSRSAISSVEMQAKEVESKKTEDTDEDDEGGEKE